MATADCRDGGGEGETLGDESARIRAVFGAEAKLVEEWTDVKFELLPLDDVARVQYTPRFRLVFGLLVAAQALRERSERGLRLAKRAIELVKSHVSAWRYRLECARALAAEDDSVWNVEAASVGKLLLKSPKNYQAWDYRRACVQGTGKYADETMYIEVALNQDAKNYHAWAHRQWLLRGGHLNTEEEINTCNRLLDDDLRNNSAWNHLYIVVKPLYLKERAMHVTAALERVKAAPTNQALWNFVAALVRSGVDSSEPRAVAAEVVKNDQTNVAARRFLLRTAPDAEHAISECGALAHVDTMRQRYWEFRARQWRAVHERIISSTKSDKKKQHNDSA